MTTPCSKHDRRGHGKCGTRAKYQRLPRNTGRLIAAACALWVLRTTGEMPQDYTMRATIDRDARAAGLDSGGNRD